MIRMPLVQPYCSNGNNDGNDNIAATASTSEEAAVQQAVWQRNVRFVEEYNAGYLSC